MSGRIYELTFSDGYEPVGVAGIAMPKGTRITITWDGSELFRDVDLTGLDMNAEYCIVRVRDATTLQEEELTTDPTSTTNIRVSADVAPPAGKSHHVFVTDVGGY